LLLGLSQITAATDSVTAVDGQSLDLPASAETANLAVAEVPGVFSPQSVSGSPSWTGWLFVLLAVVLAGLMLLGVIVISGVLVMQRRAHR
jgi:protein-S-isoprenylcysteine O-methyltransferase Ste14